MQDPRKVLDEAQNNQGFELLHTHAGDSGIAIDQH
jgi:hypothetical protein